MLQKLELLLFEKSNAFETRNRQKREDKDIIFYI